VVLTTDGGGAVLAARKPLSGADKVARALVKFARLGGGTAESVDVNGLPGVLGHSADGTTSVIGFSVDAGRIVAIDIQRNPAKLTGVRPL
jgi:RNA polymerase sigma-70 factor (ECF subfamily)